MNVRPWRRQDVEPMLVIWNEVVAEGLAFPQTEPLSPEQAADFFAAQSHCAVAEDDGVTGLYILHPNNVGRCGHIGNAAFAVAKGHRGRGVGERLVRDCMAACPAHGFTLLQFNAVVATNRAAIHLYEKLGFTRLGAIPGGFLLPDGSYTDIYPYYIALA